MSQMTIGKDLAKLNKKSINRVVLKSYENDKLKTHATNLFKANNIEAEIMMRLRASKLLKLRFYF